MIASLAEPHHGKQLLGPFRRLVTHQPVQHLRDHHIFQRGKFGKQPVKLEHETDMRAAKPPALAAAEPACGDAVAADIPLVATNDCRFEKRDMVMPHDVLLCIGNGRKLAEDDRPRFTPEHYFKTAEEMASLFADIPEAIRNTLVIAQRCSAMAEMR